MPSLQLRLGGGGCSLLASPSLPRLPSSTARFARTRTAPLCAQPAFNLNCFRLAGTQRERGKAEARAAGVNPFLPLLFGFLAEIDSKPLFKQVYFKTCSKNRCLSRSVEIFLQQMCCNQGFLSFPECWKSPVQSCSEKLQHPVKG